MPDACRSNTGSPSRNSRAANTTPVARPTRRIQTGNHAMGLRPRRLLGRLRDAETDHLVVGLGRGR